MASFWRWYCRNLERTPAITKAVTSSVVFAAGDAACQSLEATPASSAAPESHQTAALSANAGCGILTADSSSPESSRASQIDLVRCARVGATAMLWNGPATHYWYMALERGMRGFQPGLVSLATRLAADAFIFTPVALPGYFIVRGALEGLPADQIEHKLRDKYVETITTSWCFWPLANIVNFTMVPLQFRVLFNNTLSLGWSAMLSKAHSSAPVEAPSTASERSHEQEAPSRKPVGSAGIPAMQ